jgi:exonuclease-1
MGISGLLPFLKDATEAVNIKQFAGSTVAIDTYCWIYKGAFSCAEQLALGQETDGYSKFLNS